MVIETFARANLVSGQKQIAEDDKPLVSTSSLVDVSGFASVCQGTVQVDSANYSTCAVSSIAEETLRYASLDCGL